jgi:hypothetical protein
VPAPYRSARCNAECARLNSRHELKLKVGPRDRQAKAEDLCAYNGPETPCFRISRKWNKAMMVTAAGRASVCAVRARLSVSCPTEKPPLIEKTIPKPAAGRTSSTVSGTADLAHLESKGPFWHSASFEPTCSQLCRSVHKPSIHSVATEPIHRR